MRDEMIIQVLNSGGPEQDDVVCATQALFGLWVRDQNRAREVIDKLTWYGKLLASGIMSAVRLEIERTVR